MRLDLFVLSQKMADSRERAKRLILSGAVLLDGEVVTKPSLEVVGTPTLTVRQESFVGRGGEKLLAALRLFGVDVTGVSAIDIGASTGGFTDCLLKSGAAHVTAVDVGSGQLHPTLLCDPRVTNIEKYNARALSPEDVGVSELAVMDVSFISQTLILPRIPLVLQAGGRLLSLIKPQFEAGPAAIGKNGIVKDPAAKLFAIRRVLAAAAEAGLFCLGVAPSPILGGDGNQEFLAYFVKQEGACDNSRFSIEKTVLEKAVIR